MKAGLAILRKRGIVQVREGSLIINGKQEALLEFYSNSLNNIFDS